MFRNTLVLAALLIANAARADDEEVIAKGKAAVTAILIDPDSAQFADVRLGPAAG
jgi:hypothetical protein